MQPLPAPPWSKRLQRGTSGNGICLSRQSGSAFPKNDATITYTTAAIWQGTSVKNNFDAVPNHTTAIPCFLKARNFIVPLLAALSRGFFKAF
jgi:hypothetical protein